MLSLWLFLNPHWLFEIIKIWRHLFIQASYSNIFHNQVDTRRRFNVYKTSNRRWNDVVCLLGNWTKCFYMAIVILNWSTTFFIFWSYICKKTLALLNLEWRILQNVSTFILTIFVGIWDCWDVFVSFKLKFS